MLGRAVFVMEAKTFCISTTRRAVDILARIGEGKGKVGSQSRNYELLELDRGTARHMEVLGHAQGDYRIFCLESSRR